MKAKLGQMMMGAEFSAELKAKLSVDMEAKLSAEIEAQLVDGSKVKSGDQSTIAGQVRHFLQVRKVELNQLRGYELS